MPRHLAHCLTALVLLVSASALAQVARQTKVVDIRGTRLVVQGHDVPDYVPRMPVWILEPDANGAPGLALAEGQVVSVHGDRATIEVADKDAKGLRTGLLVEPRHVAEARQYHASPKVMPGSKAPAVKDKSGPMEPAIRGRHRSAGSVRWGAPLWVEVVVEGPADKTFVLWRLGNAGPYAELALERKGDGLFGAFVPLGEPDPSFRVVQYYLVAQGTAGRVAVAASPADPISLSIDAVPDRAGDTLIMHGSVDRASHHKPILLVAEVNKRFKKAMVFYRARGTGSYVSVPMEPFGPEQLRAVIPARDVVAPGLAYYIAVVDEKGIVRDAFGSSRSPQHVSVMQSQILSNEENRNQLSLRYMFTDFGTADDRYHDVELGLDRLFFGFLIARLSGGLITGRSIRFLESQAGQQATRQLLEPKFSLYRGRAGIDLHLGDYVSISGDLSVAIYSGGSGLGFRAGGRLGDEQVAAIDFSMERIWDQRTGDRVVDLLRGTLSAPVADGWRVFGAVVQDRVLQMLDAPKGLRLLGGVEVDLGSHVLVELTGGLAGRNGDAIGPTGGGGMKLKF